MGKAGEAPAGNAEPLLEGEGSDEGTASVMAITANLITGGLGAGMLSLPWTAAGASVLGGALITAVALGANAWTNLILVEAAEKHQVFDIGAVLGRIPGPLGSGMSAVSNVMVWITCFLCLVSYMIVVSDSVHPELAGMGISRTMTVMISSLCVLPLCYLDQRKLSFSSTLSIAVNIYICGLVAFESVTNPWDGTPPCYVGLGGGSISMFSVLMQAVVIQMCVLPMYQSLEKRSIQRFKGVLVMGFSFLFLLFAVFQTLALLAFGPQVRSNVLKSLPNSPAGSAARLGMLLVVMGVYPIVQAPMVAPIRNSPSGGARKAGLATAFIVVAAAFVACSITRLGSVNVISGAIQVGGFVAVTPSLVGMHLLGKRQCPMLALMAFGLFMSVIGLIYTDNYVEELEGRCLLSG